MTHRPSIFIGRDAIVHLIGYISTHKLARISLVADENTYAVLGSRVETALRGAGLDVNLILLDFGPCQ